MKSVAATESDRLIEAVGSEVCWAFMVCPNRPYWPEGALDSGQPTSDPVRPLSRAPSALVRTGATPRLPEGLSQASTKFRASDFPDSSRPGRSRFGCPQLSRQVPGGSILDPASPEGSGSLWPAWLL